MAIVEYDLRHDGTPPPLPVLAMLTTPNALQARAEVRMQMAAQDALHGDTWAYNRNQRVAEDMRRRAAGGVPNAR